MQTLTATRADTGRPTTDRPLPPSRPVLDYPGQVNAASIAWARAYGTYDASTAPWGAGDRFTAFITQNLHYWNARRIATPTIPNGSQVFAQVLSSDLAKYYALHAVIVARAGRHSLERHGARYDHAYHVVGEGRGGIVRAVVDLQHLMVTALPCGCSPQAGPHTH